ncbi:uncharacterized protein [Prorops nasuta]|uniref:uncharacterized protein n=1 Tax=Prorops nasuta TaxID=863751 RepID=UPI0034CD507C
MEESDFEIIINEIQEDCSDNNNRFEWTLENTKLLLEEVRVKSEHLNKKNCINKKIWQEIACVFKSKGHFATPEQCSFKWKNLKQKYKKIKDNNQKTGNSRETWVHFNVINEIMDPMPEVNPVSLAYSVLYPEKNYENACCSNIMPKRTITKRSNIKKNVKPEDFYKQKEKHHRENLELKKEFLSLLKVHLKRT